MIRGEYHAVSVYCHGPDDFTVMHTRMDGNTRKVISEHLMPPLPAPEGEPWLPDEVLMLASTQLTERRLDREERVRL